MVKFIFYFAESEGNEPYYNYHMILFIKILFINILRIFE